MSYRYVLQSLICIAAALCAATATAAGRWRYVEPQVPRAIEPADFALAADGSLWLLTDGGVRRHYANGITVGVLAAAPDGDGYTSVKPAPDNGAIVGTSTGCTLTRVDASVHRRWTRQLPDYCEYVPVAGEAAWAATYAGTLYRIDAGGAIERQIAIAQGPTLLVAMPDGGVVVVSGEAGAAPRSTLTRYSRGGAILWTTSRDGTFYASAAADARGELTLGGMAGTDVVVARYGADGTPLRQYASPREADRAEGDIAVRIETDGSTSVMTSSYGVLTIEHRVHRFDNTGAFLWRKDVCTRSSSTFMPPAAVQPLSGGGLFVACSGENGARLLRYDAAGLRVADEPLPTLWAKLERFDFTRLKALGDAPGTFAKTLYTVGVDEPALIAPQPLDLVDRLLADDGTSWLLSRSTLRADAPASLVLTRLDANGAVLWRETVAAIAPHARLAVGGGQACITQSRRPRSPWPTGFPEPPPPPAALVSIVCVAAADGAQRWSRTYPADTAEHHFGALGDGTLVHVRSAGTTHEIVRHDSAGNETARVEGTGYVLSAVIAANGDVALGVVDAPRRRILRYGASGAPQVIDVDTTYGFEVVGTTADAVQAIVATAEGREYRWYRGGAVAWARPLGDLFALPIVDGDAVYLAEQLPPTNGRDVLRIARLAAAGGAVVWRAAPLVLAPNVAGHRQIVLAAAHGQVAAATATPHRIQALRFDARDGALLGEHVDACDTGCGRAQAIAVDAPGTVRVALPLVPFGLGTAATSAVVALPDTAAQPALRIDQRGLAGGWWAPYANGEGFVVDWLPESRTWFMPWFTFARDGGDGSRAAQRWYTIAGVIGDGATQAELPILETIGGTFDAAGGATVRRVGTATLRFTDCNNGTLRYVFDAPANGGASGTIALTRLTSLLADCVRADGSVLPHWSGTIAGFETRMSGSWYEPATSGQGLQLLVDPGRLVFAPWFTFDPAGVADDPGRQRWYTVQGWLDLDTDGRAELPIVETTGGTFDGAPAERMAVVGKATLTRLACDRATLDYAFDTAAGDLAGRTGSIDLVKAGGCLP